MNQAYPSLTIISHSLSCGGTEKVIVKLANNLSITGVKVKIITLGKANLFEGFDLSEEIEIIEFIGIGRNSLVYSFLNTVFYIYKLNNYFKKNKSCSYLSFLPIPTIISLIASFNIRIQLFASERVNPSLQPDLSIKWKVLRKLLYRRLSRLVVQKLPIN